MVSIKQILKVAVFAMLASACMTQSANASNIYEPGSVPAKMFEVVKPVVGELVTPIFIRGDAPSTLISAVNPVAAEQTGIGQATLDYYLANLRPESHDHGVVGYALGGYGVPGNESSNRTCAIIVASPDQMKTTGTFFHESVHCKNFYEMRADSEAWNLASSMNTPDMSMTGSQFMSLFHEVLAAYVQVAYSSNQGIVDGLGMVLRAAEPNANTATSIGFRTARNALYLCSKKDACSTYSPDIVRMLAKDPDAKVAMLKDIKELFNAASATGYIVENKR